LGMRLQPKAEGWLGGRRASGEGSKQEPAARPGRGLSWRTMFRCFEDTEGCEGWTRHRHLSREQVERIRVWILSTKTPSKTDQDPTDLYLPPETLTDATLNSDNPYALRHPKYFVGDCHVRRSPYSTGSQVCYQPNINPSVTEELPPQQPTSRKDVSCYQRWQTVHDVEVLDRHTPAVDDDESEGLQTCDGGDEKTNNLAEYEAHNLFEEPPPRKSLLSRPAAAWGIDMTLLAAKLPVFVASVNLEQYFPSMKAGPGGDPCHPSAAPIHAVDKWGEWVQAFKRGPFA